MRNSLELVKGVLRGLGTSSPGTDYADYGAAKFLGVIATGMRTQLTIAITGGATILRVEYKTMLRPERKENFLFVLHL